MPVPRLRLCRNLCHSWHPRGRRRRSFTATWPRRRGVQRAWMPPSSSLHRQPHQCLHFITIRTPLPLLLLILPLLLRHRPPGLWISLPDTSWKLCHWSYPRGAQSSPPWPPPYRHLCDAGDRTAQTRQSIGGIALIYVHPLPCPL